MASGTDGPQGSPKESGSSGPSNPVNNASNLSGANFKGMFTPNALQKLMSSNLTGTLTEEQVNASMQLQMEAYLNYLNTLGGTASNNNTNPNAQPANTNGTSCKEDSSKSDISNVVSGNASPPMTDNTKSCKSNTCPVCKMEFSQWKDWRSHVRGHTDFRPHKCHLCEKAFCDLYKLRRHVQTHSGVKPFQCHICDTKVSRQEHLRRHLLTHMEGKPYQCSACVFSARRADIIKSHIKTKHLDEPASVIPVYSAADIEEHLKYSASQNQNTEKKKKKKKKKVPTATLR